MRSSCSNLEKKKENAYIPVYKKVRATTGEGTRPNGLCEVVDISTSSSPERVFRTWGKVRREELSLLWGLETKLAEG